MPSNDFLTDVLTEILNRRKKKLELFRKGKKQVKVQDFQLSDEEDNAKPKRVSFLKSKKTSSPLESRYVEKDDTEKGETEKGDTEKGETVNSINSALNESSQSTLSSGKSERGQGHSVLTPESKGSISDSSQLWQARSETSVSQRGQSESSVEKRDLSESSSPQRNQSESPQSQKHFLPRNGRSDSSASVLFHSENRQRDSSSPHLSEEGQRVSPHSTESSEHGKTVTSGSQEPHLPQPRERGVKEKSTTGQ